MAALRFDSFWHLILILFFWNKQSTSFCSIDNYKCVKGVNGHNRRAKILNNSNFTLKWTEGVHLCWTDDRMDCVLDGHYTTLKISILFNIIILPFIIASTLCFVWLLLLLFVGICNWKVVRFANRLWMDRIECFFSHQVEMFENGFFASKYSNWLGWVTKRHSCSLSKINYIHILYERVCCQCSYVCVFRSSACTHFIYIFTYKTL